MKKSKEKGKKVKKFRYILRPIHDIKTFAVGFWRHTLQLNIKFKRKGNLNKNKQKTDKIQPKK